MPKKTNQFRLQFKKRIYSWTLNLVKFVDELSRDLSSQIIAQQLMRSGTSIGANYEEAGSASSRRDFVNFLHHCLKSANESLFWLYLSIDTGKVKRSKNSDILIKELEEITKILAASLITIKNKRNF